VPRRKKLPNNIATNVITACKRRCCLCWGLDDDNSEKPGQIAHLDRNPSNDDLDNLAWLCLDHHDRYDGRTSQSRGLTIEEVKYYRDKLVSELSARTESSLSDLVTSESKTKEPEIELTNDCVTVLGVLAHSEQYLYDLEITQKLRWNNTKTKHCLDLLSDADFVDTSIGEYGLLYYLSKKGRGFAVHQGLVK
jgi:hypothetical protein